MIVQNYLSYNYVISRTASILYINDEDYVWFPLDKNLSSLATSVHLCNSFFFQPLIKKEKTCFLHVALDGAIISNPYC